MPKPVQNPQNSNQNSNQNFGESAQLDPDMPDDVLSFAVAIDRPLCLEGGDRRYAMATLRAADLKLDAPRPPLAVAFALDRSGSMSGDKLRLTCEAVRVALRHLQPQDAFALVVFDGHVDVLTPLRHATPDALEEATQRLDQVQARGNTALHAGWRQAAMLLQEEAARLVHDGCVRRVILLTDGQANEGITDPEKLQQAAGEMAARGVVTTTLGVGEGFAESLLASMAAAGHGQFHFAQTASDLPRIMELEVGEAAKVVARQVMLRCVAGPLAHVQCVSAFAVQQQGNRLEVAVGDLRARQELRILLAVDLAGCGEGSALEFTVADRDGELPLPVVRVHWQAADAHAVRTQLQDAALAGTVAQRLAAQAVIEMTEANRNRDFGLVELRWRQLRDQLRALGAHLPEVNAVLDQTEPKAHELMRDMDEMSRKDAHFRAMMASKSRRFDGSSEDYRSGPGRGNR